MNLLRVAGSVLAAGGWTLAAVLAFGAACTASGTTAHPVIAAVQGATPRLVPLGILVAALLLLLAPFTGGGVPGGVLLATSAVWLLLLLPVTPVTGEADGDGFDLLAANLLLWNEDIARAGADIARAGADIVVTLETGEDVVDELAAHMPGYRPVSTGSGERGRWAVLWVHERIDDRIVDVDRRLVAGGETYPGVVYRPEAGEDGNDDVHVVGIHLHSPGTRKGARKWQAELADLARSAGDVNDRGGRLVLAGDFNASRAHPAMGRLLKETRDAGRTLLGTGTPTWPVRGRGDGTYRLFPPMLDIDHILTAAGVAADGHRVVGIAGSDHLAVQAHIRLRR